MSIWLLALLSWGIIGCGSENDLGEASIQVANSALSAADVAQVTITVSASDMTRDIVHDLVYHHGQWQGTIGAIPVGTNRTFHAAAFNGADTLIYEGEISGVTITRGGLASVIILLQQSEPVDPVANIYPFIDAVAVSANAVAPEQTVDLSVVAHDDDLEDTIAFEWTSTCGTFDSETSTTPVWTAPATEGDCVLTIVVTDDHFAEAAMSLTINVSAAHGRGRAAVQAIFNSWPEVSGLIATPGRVDVNGTLTLDLTVSDSESDPLTFAWTDGGGDCTGTFSSTTIEDPSWTAPGSYPVSGMCTLTATINDGNGGSNTASVTIHVAPPEVENVAPVIDSTFQSSETADPSDVIILRVEASDPEGGLLAFIWSATGGTLGVPDSDANLSEVSWTAPVDASAAPWTITATIRDTEGISTLVDFIVAPTGVWSDIVYVNAATGSDANSGRSWAEALATVQAGLSLAEPDGSEVWVAAGTYYPTEGVDRTATFQLVPGVELYGGFAGIETNRSERDIEANETILSGDIGVVDDNSDNVYHVVTGANDALIDGFIITSGNANGSGFQRYGGGMMNESSSSTVTNCVFSGNSSTIAGSGMFNYISSPTVTNCIFSNNVAFGSGGGMHNSTTSSPMVTNCTFFENTAQTGGGGMYNNVSSSPIVVNCIFLDNDAIGSIGGGMVNDSSSSSRVTNCIFNNNYAGNGGGGMCNISSSPALTNCTFSGNTANNDGGGIYNINSSPTMTSSILWGNTATTGPQIINAGTTSSPVITFSDIQGGYTGIGNINADPLFGNALANDLHLQVGSPCIDAGNTSSLPADTTDLDEDGDIIESIPLDLDGNPRVSGAALDIGAYEVL